MTNTQAAERQAAHECLITEAVAVLTAAREQIAEDREALFACHRSFATGKVEDRLACAALRQYDKTIARIDNVLARAKEKQQ